MYTVRKNVAELMAKLDLKPDAPEEKDTSPLDVEDVDINVTVKDILKFIHESRKE